MMTRAAFPRDDSSAPRIWQGEDALNRLSGLGIDSEAIFAALHAGDVAARQADEYSPVTASGTERWNHTVQELRRNLAMQGWHVQNPNNSPRIVRPDGELSISVVSGDERTGNPDKEPRNAHPLGQTVDESVFRNRAKEVTGQTVLESVEDDAIEHALRTGHLDASTWILLYFDEPGTGLRAELSYPHATADGYVSAWPERIIIPLEQPMDELLPLETPVEDVEFEIREA